MPTENYQSNLKQQETKPVDYQTIALDTLDLRRKKTFRVYKDSDVIKGLTEFDRNGKKNLIDSV